MKRVSKLFPICCFMAFICIGCDTAKDTPSEGSSAIQEPLATEADSESGTASDDFEVNQIFGIEMTVDGNTAETADYTIINHSDQLIDYGEDYGIQIQRDGVWEDISQKDITIIAIGYSTLPDSQNSYTVNWADAYGKLKPGTYRLIKGITYEEKDYWLAAEFTVED